MSGRERFRVHVLGRFRLLTEDTPVSIPPRLRKPQELLQALIALGGTEVSAGALIDALWPDSEGDAAYHALEPALYRLRQLLGARDAVRMEGGKVSLDRDQLWVDVWESRKNCGVHMIQRRVASKGSTVSGVSSGAFSPA
jgi:DNA-binding SARP family transcriptional activator